MPPCLPPVTTADGAPARGTGGGVAAFPLPPHHWRQVGRQVAGGTGAAKDVATIGGNSRDNMCGDGGVRQWGRPVRQPVWPLAEFATVAGFQELHYSPQSKNRGGLLFVFRARPIFNFEHCSPLGNGRERRRASLNPLLSGTPHRTIPISISHHPRAILESLARAFSFSLPFHSRVAHKLRLPNQQLLKRSVCVLAPAEQTDRTSGIPRHSCESLMPEKCFQFLQRTV